MNTRKGIAPIVIILTVALVGGGAGYFGAVKKYCEQVAPPKPGAADSRFVEREGKLYRCSTLFGRVGQSLRRGVLPAAEVTPTTSDTNAPARNGMTGWKNCRDDTRGYSFEYPSEWNVFRRGAGDSVPASCGESAALSFAPNRGETGINSFVVDVVTQERIGSVFVGAKTLDQYFERSPRILEVRPIIKESSLDGERLVQLADRSFLAFHGGVLYEFHASGNVSDTVVNQILSTFRFTR